VGAAVEAELSRDARILAEALMRIHGPITVAREASGLHFYMASPAALERDGIVELAKRHLAVNADRYLGVGRYANLSPKERARAGQCMKTSHGYSVQTLLRMPPLEKRGIAVTEAPTLTIQRKTQWLVRDQYGDEVPMFPPRTTRLDALPPQHPAIEFLHSRRYDPARLQLEYDALWCDEEVSEDPAAERYYRKLPDAWKITSQGRILFPAIMNGRYRGWQGRIPQREVAGIRSYWHPYRGRWEECEYFCAVTRKWLPLAHLTADRREWEMLRYFTGPGTSRSEILLGLDHAVAARYRYGSVPTVVLAEGPLDVARFGQPALPLLGKFLGQGQAETIARHFKRVLYVRDDDASGLAAAKSVTSALAGRCQVLQAVTTDWPRYDMQGTCKDGGDLLPEAVPAFLNKHGLHT
jgi:hypothetical protein